jgi:hypothetical protein
MANGFKPLKQKDIKPLREKLWKQNNFCCPICKRELDQSELALDHDHDTTLIRNTICKRCNSLEGALKAKWKRSGLMKHISFVDFLTSLSEYLNNDQLPFIHPMHTAKPRKLMKSSYNELKREVEKANTYLKKQIKIPDYPKSKRLTKKLKEIYDKFGIYPRYYSK